MATKTTLKRWDGTAYQDIAPKTTWDQILDKPTLFNPVDHTHLGEDIVDGDFSNINTIEVSNTSSGGLTDLAYLKNDATGNNTGARVDFGFSSAADYYHAGIQAFRTNSGASHASRIDLMARPGVSGTGKTHLQPLVQAGYNASTPFIKLNGATTISSNLDVSGTINGHEVSEFLEQSEYTVPSGSLTGGDTLQGGEVYSDFTFVDGHVTGKNTKTLTASDVGAAESSHNHTLANITDSGNVAGIDTTGSTTNFLRGDGNWATPPNTNTTYSEISETEINDGTASTLRTITGRRAKHIVDTRTHDTVSPHAAMGITTNVSRTYSVQENSALGGKLTVNVPWVDTNTTYSSMTVAEGEEGTATTNRSIRAANLKAITEHRISEFTGDLAMIDKNNNTSQFLRGDGNWATPDTAATDIESKDVKTSYTASTGSLYTRNLSRNSVVNMYSSFNRIFYVDSDANNGGEFERGDSITVIKAGSGDVRIRPNGSTLLSNDGTNSKASNTDDIFIEGQYQAVTLIYRGSSQWFVVGGVAH